MNFDLQTLILILPPVLLALTFHEFMHGYAAYKFGDNTAKNMGRLTFNPLAHLDPIGTLMIILVRFGWAKPVPVNPYNLRNPRQDMVIISAAGPAANLALGLISGLLLRFIRTGALAALPQSIVNPVYLMVYFSLQINIALAFFNLIPIPPLDGSKILRGVIPREQEHIVDWLEHYGGFILMGLILSSYITGFSVIGMFLRPFILFFSRLFGGV
ncbi:MAG: site-2 protease family protein [Candidatus Marinimicrobia bacterium]|nr:site-2 protease family protein [Candidatus Neomarinimicrobiota bacterium]